MTQKTQWGIIGPGRIAHRFAQALEAEDVGELYAVASRDVNRGKAFAQQYHAAVAYQSYADLLADPLVDVVYIATPHMFHFETAKQCIMAGKAVLVEKPMTINVKQSEALIELAREKSVFLMEGMWTLFLPIYEQVNQWLSDNKIGDVKLITSSFGFNVPKDEADRYYNPDLAGGVLLDMGIYNVATSQWFHQQDDCEITCDGLVAKTGVDEMCLVNLKYPSGTATQFVCNFNTQTINDLTIYGTKGHIRIHPMFWDTATATLQTESENVTIDKPFEVNGFEYEIKEVEACLRAGKLESSLMTHQRTLSSLKVMDTIRAKLGVVYPNE
ncbi:Gfo/Idh/MocA family protein [Algibacillus agarilyticus]|uniref:Gfo/Idh/MocA family protein n=1 Tax=Algibacillus agarilyticus TaxID=2234133 RepID=UPI000DD07CD7|nr:Gfo/Idh/MocA family oxidoreductase [Algibacillus agarilyticus]